MTVLLRVTYRVRSHHVRRFEEIFEAEVTPLIGKHRLRLKGMWKTVVGSVGEYMELWEFKSMQEFEESWQSLMDDPELIAIFERTGPMVENENFTLLKPLSSTSSQGLDPEVLKV